MKLLLKNCIIVIMSFITTFILAVLVYFAFDTKYGLIDAMGLLTSIGKETYRVNELSMYGYELVDGGAIVSNCDDGQLYLPYVNNRIVNICIFMDEASEYDVPVSIYYTLGTESFSEEEVIHTTLQMRGRSLEVPIKMDVSNIRIDIGNKSGEQFKINNITVNHKPLWTSSKLYLYWAVLLFGALLFLYRNSELVIQCKNKISAIVNEGLFI